MQFKCLIRDPFWHDNRPKGSRFMKYDNLRVDNVDLKKNYPFFWEMFDQTQKLCATYFFRVSPIRCEYVCAGRKFLVNLGGVKEQNVHDNYGPTQTVLS